MNNPDAKAYAITLAAQYSEAVESGILEPCLSLLWLNAFNASDIVGWHFEYSPIIRVIDKNTDNNIAVWRSAY